MKLDQAFLFKGKKAKEIFKDFIDFVDSLEDFFFFDKSFGKKISYNENSNEWSVFNATIYSYMCDYEPRLKNQKWENQWWSMIEQTYTSTYTPKHWDVWESKILTREEKKMIKSAISSIEHWKGARRITRLKENYINNWRCVSELLRLFALFLKL